MMLSEKLLPTAVAHAEELEKIPGLRVSMTQMRGSVDAIAAARRLLGEAPPAPSKNDGTVKLPPTPVPLRSYQEYGIRFLAAALLRNGGAILADEPGLGKTLQALLTMRLLGGRGLVLCPAAARETWRDELTKWGFTDSVVLSPTQTKAAKAEWERAHEARIVVCSYDHRMIERAVEAAFTSTYPKFLILDEAHRIRGRNSLRTKALKDVTPLISYKLALTATPQYDRPRDFYQILHALFGNAFGTQYEFDERYCGWTPYTRGGTGNNTGATNTEELRLRLNYHMLRREKKDVAAELPPLQRQVRWVDGTKEARIAFEAHQMGLSRSTMHAAIESTLKAKMEEAYELAEESKRFLLFTYLKEHAHQMAHHLSVERNTPCVCITGELPTEKRAALIREARDKGWGVVATLDSASESLNLQGLASVGIMHAVSWEPQKMVQAEGRLHRLGTTDRVLWYYIAMRNSVDTVIVQSVVNKLDMYRDVMGQRVGLRNDLGDHIDGATSEAADKAILADMLKELQSD